MFRLCASYGMRARKSTPYRLPPSIFSSAISVGNQPSASYVLVLMAGLEKDHFLIKCAVPHLIALPDLRAGMNLNPSLPRRPL